MQIPIPVNTMFTLDAIEELYQDHVLPPNVLTYADLEFEPKKVSCSCCSMTLWEGHTASWLCYDVLGALS